ncbi:hypothetical protein EDD36DRAFT_241670 [Exophiala viscosa]|uniref:Uncharacterized protein n=1 Tax=Exophiala viscosa TaxID=2486360 RepID=A0AAN6DWP5_9EURO|nr:hypothetical protein EDD36DRAFT_241670 [Exophiala viscosa]
MTMAMRIEELRSLGLHPTQTTNSSKIQDGTGRARGLARGCHAPPYISVPFELIATLSLQKVISASNGDGDGVFLPDCRPCTILYGRPKQEQGLRERLVDMDTLCHGRSHTWNHSPPSNQDPALSRFDNDKLYRAHEARIFDINTYTGTQCRKKPESRTSTRLDPERERSTQPEDVLDYVDCLGMASQWRDSASTPARSKGRIIHRRTRSSIMRLQRLPSANPSHVSLFRNLAPEGPKEIDKTKAVIWQVMMPEPVIGHFVQDIGSATGDRQVIVLSSYNEIEDSQEMIACNSHTPRR